MSKRKNLGYKKSKKKPNRSEKTYGKQNSSRYRQSKGKRKESNGPPRGRKSVTAEVTCSDLSFEGKGIVQWKGKQLEVPLLLPGEKAEVTVFQKGQSVNAELKRVITPAKDRVDPPCPYYYECGGCQLQHMSYQSQLRFKQETIDALMKPFRKPEPILAMDHPYDYRNKSHTTFGLDQNRKVIGGLYAQNTHEIIPMDRCLIHDPKADEIVQSIKDYMKNSKMQPYNEDTGQGFLRHVLIKVGKVTEEIMVVLVAASSEFKGKKNFLKALRKAHPEITTMLLNVNKRDTSVVLGNQEHVLFGKGTITDMLCGLKFEISAKSFYQINPVQTEKLYGKAIEMAELTGKETVLDAYCGVGTIGLVASQKAEKVIGVEMNKEAVRDAIQNSKRNGVKNARFYQGDAGEFMIEMAERGDQADVVIMDPPRSGSDEAFLSSVVKLKPKRIVYVSCNPETQVRDLRYLVKNGYDVEEIQPVDMFPQTYHVESVAKLVLKV
ncbi:23S rRNA (uracil-C(5))-methyltransferase RlmCD [Halobacillus andaensis]|uniref:23S rRNA (Uracil-C(5))-methyltransferase RlmCD n=1 Tax=Halobacillus andaensis TaxID=1176239 RepID=A0A917B869_HALAA|nr:23S rRNA (uracil(1939)-C(5))-methyltransferase RlmD [Halobacillus andaensis]MBP2006503.1 23S rRNA (uracil1939-C5)-methyltransferase [Halobacillus andaensis]GGF27852.1 23S rRNA (uracil-C(5))-methyltransferase RlmCD [Halobacillus andaensis]